MLIVHMFIEVTSADEVFGLSVQAEVSANLHSPFKSKNEVIVETVTILNAQYLVETFAIACHGYTACRFRIRSFCILVFNHRTYDLPRKYVNLPSGPGFRNSSSNDLDPSTLHVPLPSSTRTLYISGVLFDLPAVDFGIAPPGNADDGLSLHHMHDLDHIDKFSLNEELDEDFVYLTHKDKVAGTAIMINNVGSIAQALVAQGSPDHWNEGQAAKIQAAQISTISVMNCFGRIAIKGVSSDFGKHKYNYTTRPEKPFLPSATLGLACGAMFSHATVVLLDWFGLPYFSMNWAFMGIAPVIEGNIFSIAFGRNLDEHAAPDHPTSPNPVARAISDLGGILSRGAGGNAEQLCFDGSSCYAASLKMTVVASIIAAALSAWATWRDRTELRWTAYKKAYVLHWTVY
ncbi:hypothetical protein BS47DRAFT_1397618 [Hydnum rufescens UP504]|uniref:Uncharacterized protein n=1 Tax=Hydnum rufescens UP504 TaxID=1448309 RepID=A0A9P6APM5_9AGAM|nr:hypothetical protein BS47DRAFT_1397618 [Hydnum rufescens UP504]